jgi:hypothetical protein
VAIFQRKTTPEEAGVALFARVKAIYVRPAGRGDIMKELANSIPLDALREADKTEAKALAFLSAGISNTLSEPPQHLYAFYSAVLTATNKAKLTGALFYKAGGLSMAMLNLLVMSAMEANDNAAAAIRARNLAALARDLHDVYIYCLGNVFLAVALYRQGQTIQCIEPLQEGLAFFDQARRARSEKSDLDTLRVWGQVANTLATRIQTVQTNPDTKR